MKPAQVTDRKERRVLAHLREGPQYPLDMVLRSAGMLKRGTIYVILAQMEGQGLIGSHLEESREGPGLLPRRRYSLTEAGERVALVAEREGDATP